MRVIGGLMVDFISLLCLIIEIVLVFVYVRISLKKSNFFSRSNILFFAPIFILVFILYLTAVANDVGISMSGIVACLAASVKASTFEVNKELISFTLNGSKLFSVSFYLTILMFGLTIIGSIISLFQRKLINFLRVYKALRNEYDVVLNYDENALNYAKYNSVWFVNDGLTPEQIEILFNLGIPYSRRPLNNKLFKVFRNKKAINFLDFAFDETKYLGYAKELESYYDNTTKRNIYLRLAAPMEKLEVLKENIVSRLKLNTYITCFSRHELIARAFGWEYPLSRFLPKGFIDANGCLENDKEINVLFLGFGKKSQEIMRVMVLNNQFPSYDGKYYNHQVNYYAFDHNDSCINNLEISKLIRQINNKKCQVEKICNFSFSKIDVFASTANANKDIFDDINGIVSKPNTFNFFVICFGDDMTNINFVSAIRRYTDELTNCVSFIHLKNDFEKPKNTFSFGSDRVLFSHKNIIDNLQYNMAMRVHAKYTKLNSNPIDSWEKLDILEQFSNIYSVLNIRFKLNLMGLDLKHQDNGINEDEYYKTLFKERYAEREELVKYSDYSEYFKMSLRNTFAYQEHLRWCAYYVLNSFVTLPLEEVTVQNGELIAKDKEKKKHACLVTFQKLDEVHQRYVQLTSKSLQEEETYKYDFMVIDGMYDLIKKFEEDFVRDDAKQRNLVIVKMEECEDGLSS